MIYKIGDKVRVRNDLAVGDVYPMLGDEKGQSYFTDEMSKYCGMETYVEDILCFSGGGKRYRLGVDSEGWSWTDGMLEPVEDKNALEPEAERWRSDKIPALSPDAPIEENAHGGKQSSTPFAFHMLPPSAMFAAAQTAGYGAKKYGETLSNRNYDKIPTEEHLNHALQHIYAFLADDQQDDHLAHAIVRLMFAYDTTYGWNKI